MRRVRPWVVVSGCLLALAVAAALLVRTQGDLLRESAANYLRERLAAEFGAQFQTTDLRGRWFPPGVSLGRVTLQRPGEPWVLTADDVAISFNLYAMFFRGERLGRVVLVRPRLFVRAAALAPAPESQTDVAAALVARLRGLLKPPFPLRILEVVDGHAELLDRAGRLTAADGVRLAVNLSGGGAEVDCSAAGLLVRSGERQLALRGVKAAFVLGPDGAGAMRLAVGKGPVSGEARGTVGYDGRLALQGDVTVAVGPLAAFLGRPDASGTARFSGTAAGRWDDPELA
ncbi:MAG TPA: hypothetical protein VI078_10965, partial [bacterium]